MQKIGRQVYWFTSAFLQKYRSIMVGSFAMALLLGSFLLYILPRLPKQKPTRLIGLVGRYNLTSLPKQIEFNLGAGLTTMGEKLEPVPALSKSWQVSEDGKTYTFQLDTNKKWSNGQPVKIEDINLTIPSIQIEKKTDTNEIIFKLPDVFAPFPSLLQKPIIKDGFLTLSDYTIRDIQTEGPYISRIQMESPDDILEYRFYSTLTEALTAFKLGQVDYLLDLNEKPQISSWPNVKTDQVTDLTRYVAVFFDTSDPMLGKQNKDIRQALAYAISDKTQGSTRVISPISPLSWSYNKTVKSYDFDLDRAKTLLKKGLGSGGSLNKLELSVVPELISVAEKIKLDWQQLGIETEIKVVSSRPEKFQALLAFETIPDDPDQYSIWHSTQKLTNFTKFQDEQVDKLLEDGRRTTKKDQRLKIYLDFQRFLLEESPAVFLYHPFTYSLIRG